MTRNEHLRALAEDTKKKRKASCEADAAYTEHCAPHQKISAGLFDAWDARRHELAEICREARRAKEIALNGLRLELDEEVVLDLLGATHVPVTDNFLEGLKAEAVHQRARWGESHDAHKKPEDWFWTLAYLSGKALRAALGGDVEKALHHCISSAALLSNWHAALRAETPHE